MLKRRVLAELAKALANRRAGGERAAARPRVARLRGGPESSAEPRAPRARRGRYASAVGPRAEIALRNHARAVAAPRSLHTVPPGCTGLAQEPPTRGATLPGRCSCPEPTSRRCDLAPAGASEHRYGQDLFFLLKHIRLQISCSSAHREPRYHQMTLPCQPTAIPRGKQHPALQPAPGSSGVSPAPQADKPRC